MESSLSGAPILMLRNVSRLPNDSFNLLSGLHAEFCNLCFSWAWPSCYNFMNFCGPRGHLYFVSGLCPLLCNYVQWTSWPHLICSCFTHLLFLFVRQRTVCTLSILLSVSLCSLNMPVGGLCLVVILLLCFRVLLDMIPRCERLIVT